MCLCVRLINYNTQELNKIGIRRNLTKFVGFVGCSFDDCLFDVTLDIYIYIFTI